MNFSHEKRMKGERVWGYGRRLLRGMFLYLECKDVLAGSERNFRVFCGSNVGKRDGERADSCGDGERERGSTCTYLHYKAHGARLDAFHIHGTTAVFCYRLWRNADSKRGDRLSDGGAHGS